MPSLPSISSVPKEVLVAIGAVVVLLVLLLWVRYGFRRYIVIKKSDATEAITSELARIADALDRLASLAAPRESQPPAEERPARRENWLSMFGR